MLTGLGFLDSVDTRPSTYILRTSLVGFLVDADYHQNTF